MVATSTTTINSFFYNDCSPTTTSTTSTTTTIPPICFTIAAEGGYYYLQLSGAGTGVKINNKPTYTIGNGQILWDGTKWIYIVNDVIIQTLNSNSYYPVQLGNAQWTPIFCENTIINVSYPIICSSSLNTCPKNICFKFVSSNITAARVNVDIQPGLVNGKVWYLINANPNYFYIYFDPTYTAGASWVVAQSTNGTLTPPLLNTDIWSYSQITGDFPSDCAGDCSNASYGWQNTNEAPATWEFVSVSRGDCPPLSCNYTVVATEQEDPCSNNGGTLTLAQCAFGTLNCTVVPVAQLTTTTTTP